MQTFKTHSKYFIVAALTLSIVWGVFAQVSIPTGLANAIQYIMQTVWTDDGTDSGLINVQIDDTNIYVRTGFLADGTGWNNKALGLDSSGNVVYVNANAINTPFFNLAGNYIPKINQAGDELELSSMFQWTLGDISVGHINPLAKMHIQGNFRVDTVSWSLMQYTYTTGSTQVIWAVTAPDPSQLCNCDTSPNALNCPSSSFTTGVIQGNGQGFCVDITASWGWVRNYWVYMQSTTNINQWAFIVTGNRAWVMTLTPQATLDVNGNVMIANIPTNNTPTQVLVQWPNGEIQKAAFPSWSAGEINTASNIGGWIWIFSSKVWVNLELRSIIWAWLTQVTQQGNTVQINTPAQTLSLAGQTLSISSGNSVTLPAGATVNAWNLTGNTGTNPSTNFIGTIDNNNLIFKTNNTTIGWLQTNGSVQRWIGNSVATNNATIAWGTSNQIQINSSSSTIGWGQQNNISLAGGDSATIAGGKQNIISASYATIAGWWNNTGSGISSFIGWWYQNIASSSNSTVAGWEDNRASWLYATIGWGANNRATNQRSTVAWWAGNTGGSIWSTVVGWYSNRALGSYSTVAWWSNNQALWTHNFAAGQNAIASGTNSFVWNDWDLTQNSNMHNNEFRVSSDRILLGRHTPMLNWAIQAYTWGFDIGLLGTTAADTLRIKDSLIQNLTVTTSFSSPSDNRLKKNIINGWLWESGAINLIKALSPVTYQWDNNPLTINLWFDYEAIHYGFIAQEVESILPNLVSNNDQLTQLIWEVAGWPIKTLNMTEMIPIIIQAMKEQQTIIEDLQARVTVLEQP